MEIIREEAIFICTCGSKIKFATAENKKLKDANIMCPICGRKYEFKEVTK